MKTVTINLYDFKELNEPAKYKAITAHTDFLNSIDETDGENDYSHRKEEVIESIEANEYVFFEDGELAHCTTYTDKHPKSGVTELKFHGRIYVI